jgi:hypothetical protein
MDSREARRQSRRQKFMAALGVRAICGLRLAVGLGVLGGLASVLQAGLIRTLDGHEYRGEITFGTNGFRILLGDAKSAEIPLTNVASVTFGSTATDPNRLGPLSAGWSQQDVGDVSIAGRAGHSNGAFAVRVAASDIGERADAFHFVFHRTQGDGEILARVVAIEGADRLARAGVMLRESLRADAPFVFKGVSANGASAFQSRSEGGAKAGAQATNQVALPCWLRLSKRNKQITAARSANGTTWEQTANVTWSPGEAVCIGLAVTSHSSFALATATFDHVRLTFNGIRGEYFAEPNFKNLKRTRIDPQIDFQWGLGAPAEGLPEDGLSVRWTGKIEPRFSEPYTFYVDADNSAKLWVNHHPVRCLPFPKDKARVEANDPLAIPLQAGRLYDVKLELQEIKDRASVRLGWSSRRQHEEIIPPQRLFCVIEGGDASHATNTVASAFALIPAKGVLLRNGSFVAGQVKSVDEATVKFSFRGQQEFAVPIHKTALVCLRLPGRSPAIELGRPGVLLNKGDFFEGELKKLEGRSIRLSSVLYGLRSFGLDDVAVVVLNSVAPEPAAFALRTTDGSRLQADALSVEGTLFVLEERALGPLRLPAEAVVELERSRR